MRAILGPPFCARGGYGSATPFRSWKIGLANADVEALERGCDASADNALRNVLRRCANAAATVRANAA